MLILNNLIGFGAAGGESDPYWSSVTVLLHGDGADGSTSIVNSSAVTTVTANGNAQIDTGITYWPGGSSIIFDGTGDYLTFAQNASTIIGTVNSTATFTIEAWIYNTQRATDTSLSLIGDMSVTTVTNYWSFGPNVNGKLCFYWYDGSPKIATGDTTISLNTWTHIAVSISSGAISLYVDGVKQTITGTATLTNPSGSTSTIVVGQWYNGGSARGYYGNVEELRITKGIARYAATFTKPSNPYPNQ